MRGIGIAAASAAVVALGGMGSAIAADLPIPAQAPLTKAMPAAGPAACANIVDFFTTACQLAWYGVRFYGTVDVGGGYQTKGAPLNPVYGPGVSYFLGKSNRAPMWLLSPNGLSQSNVGLQVKEPLWAGWSFVGQLETGFDPYTGRLASGPGSMASQIGVPLALQSSQGDAAANGQFYNSLGFAGFSHDTWGTLTFGRQLSLGADAIRTYDPMGAAFAFSPIGFQGTTAAGGDTEDKVATTAVKYRVSYGNVHAGALGQFGGYDLGNASKGAFQGDVGADFNVWRGTLSLDAVGGYTRDGVLLTLGPAAGQPITAPSVLQATLSNNTSAMGLAKYTVDRLQLYAGYEWIQFAPPSDPFLVTGTGFNDIAGDFICTGCFTTAAGGTNINSTAFNANDKVQQIMWGGARYALTDSLDVAVAYYHYTQNQYAGGATATGCTTKGASSNLACSGTMDAASALIDWRFAPKWDVYLGTMFSQMNGGLDAGYLARNNLATTAGLRFRW
jgi:predicted porin